ncbi:hypothetical protein [Chitinimonas sp. JJ19]|uniref:hypothetical protein n=1 Tax=Chitinimonas sp. JJ19 TaxID=3109352 RepID=UPI003002EFB4
MLRTLIRRLFKAVAWLLGTILLLLLVIILINGFDTELTPETQAWLATPPNRVSDAENGYYYLLALGVATDEPLKVGQQIARVAQQRAVGEAAVLPSTKRHSIHDLPRWQGLKPAERLAQIYRDEARYRELITREQVALRRYYQLIASPSYHNVAPNESLLFSSTQRLQQLATAEQLLRLRDGDAASLAVLAEDLRFWTTMLEGSTVLIDAMVANAQLSSQLQLLEQLALQQPELKPALAEATASALKRLGRLSMGQVLQTSLRGELRVFAHEITKEKMATHRRNWAAEAIFWFLQPNASINGLRDVYADTASPDTAMAGYCDTVLNWVYNPVGKTLTCVDSPATNHYGDKLNTTQQAARKLAALLE